MKTLNPLGAVGVSGTYTGNLISVLISLECMKMVQEPWYFDTIDTLSEALYSGINDLFKKHGIPGHLRGMGARFGLYFGVEDQEDDFDWRIVKEKFNLELNKAFIREALAEGLYFHRYGKPVMPSHNGFSVAHSAEDIEITLDRIGKVFRKLQ